MMPLMSLPAVLCSRVPILVKLGSALSAMVVTKMKKADYVREIADLTSLTATALDTLSVERLQLIYQGLKPTKVRVLPSNWKRFDKAHLVELYCEKLEPSTNTYLGYSRARLIAELEMYALEVSDDMQKEGVIKKALSAPVCLECHSPMIQRQNRLSKEMFWGCMAFPACRFTLSLQQGKMAMAAASKTSDSQETGSGEDSRGSKVKLADDSEEMEGDQKARALRQSPSKAR